MEDNDSSFFLPLAIRPLFKSGKLLHQEGILYSKRRIFKDRRIVCSGPSSRSPRSPHGVGRFRRVPGRARHADRALRWRVNVLWHADRDIGGWSDSRSFADRVDSRGGSISVPKGARGGSLEPSQATAEVSHKLCTSSWVNSSGYRSWTGTTRLPERTE